METPERDLLYGAAAIADHLGVAVGTARTLASHADFPVWKEGKMLCARRSSLDRWMHAREASARSLDHVEAEAE
jgi:hypothetical protein